MQSNIESTPDIPLKFQPSDRQMRLWAISAAFYFACYFFMIVWNNLLSDRVDLVTQKSISENVSFLSLMLMVWVVRESVPLVMLFVAQVHYEVFIMPREHEAEMKRIEDEWQNKTYVPKPRKQPKQKPVGEPINLRQWIGQRTSVRGGYVYVLKDIEISGYYKIGKTTNPHNRMKAFGVLLPFETELIHVIECDNADRIESQLHNHFSHKRKQGEWFALDNDDVNWLKLFNQINP